jgi:membrane protein
MSAPEENGGEPHGKRRRPAVVGAAAVRASAVSKRGQEWVDRQSADSASGVAINAWRRYRAVDGPLQSALLSLYILVAVLPAVLVMEEYFDPHPNSLANSIVRHFNLNAPTANLLHGVLDEGRSHELGSAFLAIVGALIFGVGFGRVLQLVHTRAWDLPLPARQADQALYGLVLLGLYGLLLLLLVQLNELSGEPEWVGLSLGVGWIGLLVLFFVWAPWMLTRKLITRRDLLPSAVLTAVGLVVLMVVSRFVMQFWVDWYARDYGGLGVVLAIYFWIAFSSAVIVWAASLSPALAQRRELRRTST